MASDLAGIWKTDAAGSLRFINADTPARAEEPAFCRLLDAADGLWIMGGDQERLTALYVNPVRPTLFQKKVRSIVERGGVVGGSSAGCAALSDVMIVGTVPGDGRGPARAELSRGLGVLSNVVAEQHFDARQGRIERFAELLRDKQQLANVSPGCDPGQMVGLAVEESTALLVRGNRLSVAGKNKAHIFLKSAAHDTLTWHTLAAGDIGVVRTAPDGSHQLHFEESERRRIARRMPDTNQVPFKRQRPRSIESAPGRASFGLLFSFAHVACPTADQGVAGLDAGFLQGGLGGQRQRYGASRRARRQASANSCPQPKRTGRNHCFARPKVRRRPFCTALPGR